jgi:hypothetical protein
MDASDGGGYVRPGCADVRCCRGGRAAGMPDATEAAERRGCPTVLGRRGFSWRRGFAEWRWLGTADHGGRSWGVKPRRSELGSEAAAAGVRKCSRERPVLGSAAAAAGIGSADHDSGDGIVAGKFLLQPATEPANFLLLLAIVIFLSSASIYVRTFLSDLRMTRTASASSLFLSQQ